MQSLFEINRPAVITWTDIFTARGEISSDRVTPLAHLRSFFGEDVTALHEFLLAQLLNTAPWTYEWTAWLSESLARLSPCKGFDSLRMRLIDPRRFMEAWTVLQIAERAHTVGLGVAFDVPITNDKESKVPDLHIYDPAVSSMFFCEISVLYSGQTLGSAYELHNRLFRLLISIGEEPLAYSGFILPGATDQDATAILNRIAWEIMEVRHDRKFREVHIPQTLLLALAPQTESDSVEMWAHAYGLELNSTAVIPPAIDQSRRLIEKIAEKAKQLSPVMPNVLVLWAQDLFIGAQDPIVLAPLVIEAISTQSPISALVLICEGPSIKFAPAQAVGQVHLSVSHRGGISYQTLIANNDAASNRLLPQTFERIVEAFSL